MKHFVANLLRLFVSGFLTPRLHVPWSFRHAFMEVAVHSLKLAAFSRKRKCHLSFNTKCANMRVHAHTLTVACTFHVVTKFPVCSTNQGKKMFCIDVYNNRKKESVKWFADSEAERKDWCVILRKHAVHHDLSNGFKVTNTVIRLTHILTYMQAMIRSDGTFRCNGLQAPYLSKIARLFSVERKPTFLHDSDSQT